jgi:hypothetical protein
MKGEQYCRLFIFPEHHPTSVVSNMGFNLDHIHASFDLLIDHLLQIYLAYYLISKLLDFLQAFFSVESWKKYIFYLKTNIFYNCIENWDSLYMICSYINAYHKHMSYFV